MRRFPSLPNEHEKVLRPMKMNWRRPGQAAVTVTQ